MKKSIILVVTLILNINSLCFASCFLGNTDARACMIQEQQMQMQRRQMEMQRQQMWQQQQYMQQQQQYQQRMMEMQRQQMNMQQRNYYGY